MKINDLGKHLYYQKLYWHTDKPPLFHRTTTTEIEWPFRHGKCLVVRAPFTKTAGAIGVWTGRHNETTALLSAMGARVVNDSGINLEDYDEW